MKKILIFSHAMEIGGAEKALLGLLEAIDTERVEVDLFLMRHSGELMRYIPSKVRLLPEIPEYACLAVPIVNVLKKRKIGIAVARWIGKRRAIYRVKSLHLPKDNDVSLQYSHKYTLPFMPMVNDTLYDLAISFLTPHYFVAEKVNAIKKAAWIHTDYSKVAIDREEQLSMWSEYDVIASISTQVTKTFLTVFPVLKNRVVLMPNIMPVKYIREQAEAFMVENEMPKKDRVINLLSVGRFCNAKNFDNIPEISKLIIEQGFDIRWYIIGFGSDKTLIEEKISEFRMQDKVIILGKKENPYPYMKQCDLYIQPSRYEGKCVSVVEAQILHKPVVITAYATAQSQLENGVDGVIVPLNIKECAEGISRVLGDKKLQKKLVQNCCIKNYLDEEAVNILYQFVEA